MEDIVAIRTDSTVVETNIHFPTNNSLVWDCIKEAHRLLSHLAEKEDIKISKLLESDWILWNLRG